MGAGDLDAGQGGQKLQDRLAAAALRRLVEDALVEIDVDDAVGNVILDVDAFHVAIGLGRAALALRTGGQAPALREVEQAALGSFAAPDQGVAAGGEDEPVPTLRARPEGRRVGNGCVRPCRSRWGPT